MALNDPNPPAPGRGDTSPGDKRQRTLRMVWLINGLVLVALISWWGFRAWSHHREEQAVQGIAFWASAFSAQIARYEQATGENAVFYLRVGEAPPIFTGAFVEAWTNPPYPGVRFAWQNEQPGQPRGVIIVARDPHLLQRIDRLIDDGDLTTGAVRVHPQGLWVGIL